ncbi:MAG: zinc ABC transporter substrate-binding protein [Euzebyales bacterium]|nr:zinc ABC transporter substrate-binding protein [Euzebyales bacterium]MBA3621622.1 zinc ABC transporter substrate-binding protein [Euzebyales bacterium]
MSRLTACLAWLVLLAAGCGGARGSSAAERAVGADLTAVASVFPLAWVAEQVAPEARMRLLNEGSQAAHDIELSPDQRAAVESAQVVLYMGDIGYQPQVEQAAGAANGQVVDVAEIAGDARLLRSGGDPHDREGEEHAGEEGAIDPHIWFDAEVMADVALRTGEAFARADPDGAGAYTDNAQDLAARLTTVDRELDELLGGDCEFDEAVVSHTAYAYLVEPRGKEIHGIAGIDPEAGASGGELADLVTEVRDEGFRHVLAEPVEGRRDAEALAAEAGVELLEISPLDTVTAEQAGAGFTDLTREQAQTFATAYGCP